MRKKSADGVSPFFDRLRISLLVSRSDGCERQVGVMSGEKGKGGDFGAHRCNDGRLRDVHI